MYFATLLTSDQTKFVKEPCSEILAERSCPSYACDSTPFKKLFTFDKKANIVRVNEPMALADNIFAVRAPFAESQDLYRRKFKHDTLPRRRLLFCDSKRGET